MTEPSRSAPSGAKVAVSARGLAKTYGEGPAAVRALRGVDVEIPAGEFVVLLGPSGSGKTTLLNLVGALESPTSGQLYVFGRSLTDLDESRRTEYRRDTVGFVFQFYNLVPTLTAVENVALLAEITGDHPEDRARAVLTAVDLSERADHFPGQLSGGEQQRVALARGLVKDPPLLLCDEPTGALDVETGKRVLATLRDLARAGSRTVLVVTHNAVIGRMADRVIHLRDGTVTGVETNPHPAEIEELEW
jgi:putative ABC transport system ATP-binding protein